MSELLIFIKVFIPVFVVVIYPGPCVLSYGNIAMNYGYKKGYAGVFGCYTIELMYWIIGIFALSTAQSFLPIWLVNILAVFAGLFLLYISYDFLKTDTSKLKIENIKNNSLVIYIKFLLLTLSNPIAIVGYAGIYIGIENTQSHILTILLASAFGSIVAHSVVVLFAGTIGKIILKSKTNGVKMLKVVNIISAICISGYSIIEILIPTTLSILK